MLTDYTDAPTIRALLGVNDKELPDETILLPMCELEITEGLLGLGATVGTMYTTVAALGSRTATQTRYYEQVRLYSATLVAKYLLATLPMLVPKMLTDSKATLERITDPFARLEANIDGLLSGLKAKVLATLAILDPAATTSVTATRRYASTAALGFDPVTGV
jgi:hypothetical protein